MAEALQPLGRDAPKAGFPARGLLGWVPALTLATFLLPICVGLLGTWLPAFGYLPAIGGAAFSLEPWRALFASPGFERMLALTITSGFLSTAIAFCLTIWFVAACHETRLFAALRRLMTPLLAVPHVAVAIGLAFLLAPSGFFFRLAAPWLTGSEIPPDLAILPDPYGLALALGLVVKEVPFLLLITIGALDQVGAKQRLATARGLGYGPIAAWMKTVLPAVYPQIRLPVYAVLAYALSVVDMAMVLGPGTPPTLAVQILRWFNDPDLSMRFAASAGACLQLGLVVLGIALWHGFECIAIHQARAASFAGRRGGSGKVQARAAGLAMAVVVALGLGGIAVMAVWSVARRWRFPDAWPSAWSLETWSRHLDGVAISGWTTLGLGLAAAGRAVALTLGCLESEQRVGRRPTHRALWLLYLPLLVPQIAFLFGAQVLAFRLGWAGTWAAVVWSHLLFTLPYAFLALADPYRALDERLLRTARCLGASPARVFWRIKLPLLLRPVLISFAVAFSVSVAQYLPTLFIGAGRVATLTTEAVALSSGADRRVLGVYTFLQAALPLAIFALAIGLPGRLRPFGPAREAGK